MTGIPAYIRGKMTYYQQQVVKLSAQLYSGDTPRQVIRGKTYIDAHFTENIELTDIAVTAFLSKCYFLRLFRQLYGTTPYRYIKMLRLERAKVLLRSGTPVADVAAAVGFESVTSFAGFFKKLTGISPSSYSSRPAPVPALPIPQFFFLAGRPK